MQPCQFGFGVLSLLAAYAMQAELSQLQSLYLQNSDGSQPNPVCSRLDYKNTVLSSLPNLKNLDGERRPLFRGDASYTALVLFVSPHI